MSKYIGRLRSIGIGKESVRGTAVAPEYWMQKMGFDFEEKAEKVLDESSIGVITDSIGQDMTKRWAEGSINGKMSDQAIGLLLLATMGDVSSALVGGETVVYEHDFTIANSNQHQSLTVGIDEANGDFDFANGMISSLELSFAVEDFVNVSANLMAKKGESATLTPSFVEENKFVGKQVCIFFADDLAGLDAADAIGGVTADLKIEKNLDMAFEFCSIDPSDIFNQQMGIEGSIELYYDDDTYKALALDNTSRAMRIRIKDTSKTIGVASNPTLEFDFAKVYLNEFARTGDNDDMVKQSMTIKSVYSQTDAKQMTAKLINLVDAY